MSKKRWLLWDSWPRIHVLREITGSEDPVCEDGASEDNVGWKIIKSRYWQRYYH